MVINCGLGYFDEAHRAVDGDLGWWIVRLLIPDHRQNLVSVMLFLL